MASKYQKFKLPLIISIYSLLIIGILVFIPQLYAHFIERKANALIEQRTAELQLGPFSAPAARCGGSKRGATGNFYGLICVHTNSSGHAASIEEAQSALSTHGWKLTYDRGAYLPKDGMPRLLLFSKSSLCAEVVSRNNIDKPDITIEIRRTCS